MAVTGKPLDRIDGRLKVRGQAKYAAEFNQEKMVYGFPVRSKIAKGTIAAFDLNAAFKAGGVLSILTHENAPKVRPLDAKEIQQAGSSLTENFIPLQNNEVYYFGQFIALVIAETYEQARAAAQLIKVKYLKLNPAIDLRKELTIGKMPEKTSQGEPAQTNEGKAATLLASANYKIENEYSTSTENHHPMETHATIAMWDGPDKITMYHATQGVMTTRSFVSYVFELKPENIHVIAPFLGGGFGSKGGQWGHTSLAIMGAKEIARPLKIVVTRQMMQTSMGRRSATIQKIALGTDKSGKLTVIRHQNNSYSNVSDFFEPSGRMTEVLYAAPMREITYKVAKLNVGAPTYMRAPGEASGSFGLESAIDEMAVKLNMDPLVFRIANHTANDPLKNHPFSSEYLLECYRIGAEKFGWSKRKNQPRSNRKGNVLIGYGMATASYPANRSAAAVRMHMTDDGKVKVFCATQDIGTGTYTIMAQVAADTLGIAVENVSVEIGDSNLPAAPLSAGSQTTASITPAVILAGEELLKQLKQLAITDKNSSLNGKTIEEVDHRDGKLFLKNDTNKSDNYTDLIRRNKKDMIEVCITTTPASGSGLGPKAPPCMPAVVSNEENRDQQQYSFHSFGVQFVEVWVDEKLGTVRVKRVVGVHDVGTIMNEKTARSQIIGGVIYAMGQALMEETVHDPRWANPVTRTLADYHVPVNLDVPPIDVHFIGKPDPHISPSGARGLGEIGGVSIAAAIANAIYNATGKRIRSLPLTPDKVMKS